MFINTDLDDQHVPSRTVLTRLSCETVVPCIVVCIV